MTARTVEKVGGGVADPPTSGDNLGTAPRFPDTPEPVQEPISLNEVDVRLVDRWGAGQAVRHGILPVRKAGALTIVAAEDVGPAEARRDALEKVFGPVAISATDRDSIQRAVLFGRRKALIERAERRTTEALSSRHFTNKRTRRTMAVAAAVFVLATVLFPLQLLTGLVLWASFWLLVSTLLRLTAAIAAGRAAPPAAPAPEILPSISVLVPLFRERDIAGQLVQRLSRLDYPLDKLEVLLIVEKHDPITRAALAEANLPAHMRQTIVPPGHLQTKPRAMNFALDFARGEIIAVYDAEDAPAPDQLKIVAAEFARARPDVACLQGRLDFYNPRTNWLSRCFTIDYAVWFRAVLPGLARLGLTVPLGGTTLFFRRDVLEKLGAWDAHNVTEDADLGIRLARHGWRTQLINTTTREEANCRVWPWIKQRSRWIKGYAITWAVHMRHPVRLWSDLGPWQFFGFQAIFLGTLSQVTLAPLLWTFWLILLGLPHPMVTTLPGSMILGLATLYFSAELTTVAVGAWACRGEKHRWLIPWVPTMHFYFPLAAVASWKGLSEIIKRPFFWDKTDHGLDPEGQA